MLVGPEFTPSVANSSSSLSISLDGSELGLRANDKRNQKVMWGQQSLGLTKSILPPLNRKHTRGRVIILDKSLLVNKVLPTKISI